MRRLFAVVAVVLVWFGLVIGLGVGCMQQTRVVRESGWRQMFKQSEWYSEGKGGPASRARSEALGYAVELGRVAGARAHGQVYQLITAARQEAGLADLWFASVDGQLRVYAGRFKSRKSPEAKATLRQAREAVVGGERVFADAELVALSSTRRNVQDPHDARTLKGRGLYALQIGYFDTAYGPDFRRAAESQVNQMREQGEKAYYYHGPKRSMVLLNAWARAEAFVSRPGQMDTYSEAVRRLQEKYPDNQVNGKEPDAAAEAPGQQGKPARPSSFLVSLG